MTDYKEFKYISGQSTTGLYAHVLKLGEDVPLLPDILKDAEILIAKKPDFPMPPKVALEKSLVQKVKENLENAANDEARATADKQLKLYKKSKGCYVWERRCDHDNKLYFSGDFAKMMQIFSEFDYIGYLENKLMGSTHQDNG